MFTTDDNKVIMNHLLENVLELQPEEITPLLQALAFHGFHTPHNLIASDVILTNLDFQDAGGNLVQIFGKEVEHMNILRDLLFCLPLQTKS